MTDETMSQSEAQGQPEGADWRAALPEELRNDPSLKDIPDVAALAKSYVHAQRMVGADKLVLPKEDAPKEEWDRFFARLGRPDEPGGYELPAPDEAKELVDGEVSEVFRRAAFDAGLSKSQAAKLWEAVVQHNLREARALEQAMEELREEGEKALRAEWGPAYDQHVQLAAKAALELGGEELIEFLDESGLGNSPELIKAFAKMGKMMADDSLAPGVSPGRWGMTPEAAARELAELRNDPAFFDQNHPKHRDLVARIEELARIAYGS